MIQLNLLFFARSRELSGTNKAAVDVPEGSTSDKLIPLLLEKFPGLESINGSFVLSLNQEYIKLDEKHTLKDGDEIAIIPPISGG